MARHEETRRLLAATFPDESKFDDPSFLDWEYDRSPSGRVIEVNEVDDEGPLGHYAVVPQRYVVERVQRSFALSLNTAVASRGRGGGRFTRLAEQTYELARSRGIVTILGVANANSSPGFTGRLGFTLLGPLPARLLVPMPGRRAGITSRAVERNGKLEDAAVAILDDSSLGGGVGRLWDRAELEWRLACPVRQFFSHRGDGWLAISTRVSIRGIPVGAILKVIASDPEARVAAGPLVRAVCRSHHTAVALYGGFNPSFLPRGVAIPRRLRPSPLNLIVKSLDDSDPAACAPSVFEFLDFDAY